MVDCRLQFCFPRDESIATSPVLMWRLNHVTLEHLRRQSKNPEWTRTPVASALKQFQKLRIVGAVHSAFHVKLHHVPHEERVSASPTLDRCLHLTRQILIGAWKLRADSGVQLGSPSDHQFSPRSLRPCIIRTVVVPLSGEK